MNIQVKSGERNWNLSLPTKLIFSKFVLGLVLKNSNLSDKLDALPAYAADAIVTELKRIGKKHGSWTLVEVDSAHGERVRITV